MIVRTKKERSGLRARRRQKQGENMTSITAHVIRGARTRNGLKLHASTVSLAALIATFAPGAIGTARAQDNSQAAGSTEQVEVSATRVLRNGFQAPTPTTVISTEDITNNAEQNIYAYISQLPSLMGDRK